VRSVVFVLHRDPTVPYGEFAAAVRAARPDRPCVVNLAQETTVLWADFVGIEPRPSKVAGTVVQHVRGDVRGDDGGDDGGDVGGDRGADGGGVGGGDVRGDVGGDVGRVGGGDARGAATDLDPALAALVVGADAYLVDDIVQWEHVDHAGSLDVGIKQIAMVGRLDGLDRSEFRRRYARGHGPLARIQHPGIWRYTQRFVVEDLTPDAPPIDTFAELHFRTLDDFRTRFYLNAEAPSVVADDTAEFLQRGRTTTIMAHEVWSGPVSTKSPHPR
jgi:hypothetical protein